MFEDHGEVDRLVELERVIAAAHAEQLRLVAARQGRFVPWLADRPGGSAPAAATPPHRTGHRYPTAPADLPPPSITLDIHWPRTA